MNTGEWQTVGPEKKVTMHFTVRLIEGDVVDTTVGKTPAEFSMGDGSLLPGFEQALLGLKAGDKRSVVLTADQAFGEQNEKNVHRMKRANFSTDIKLEPGVVVSFSDPAKAELPGVVKALDGDEVIVDFNHPLAGRELVFEVEILSVLGIDEQPTVLE